MGDEGRGEVGLISPPNIIYFSISAF
jgi:hypothetical protein